MARTAAAGPDGFMPVPRERIGYRQLIEEDLATAWTKFRADTSNFHMLHYRDVDGFFISGKNSGTQWFTFMLSHAFAVQYGIEPPRYASGPGRDTIIGPAKQKRLPGIPKIAVSHTIPSTLFASRLMHRLFEIPRCVVLVRDIPDVLESIYVKWMSDLPEEERPSLTDYVKGDPWQRGLHADVWWAIQFFNHWGRIVTASIPSGTWWCAIWMRWMRQANGLHASRCITASDSHRPPSMLPWPCRLARRSAHISIRILRQRRSRTMQSARARSSRRGTGRSCAAF